DLLLGELQEPGPAGSLGSSASRSCLMLSTSDVELAVAGDTVDAPTSSPAMTEGFGDKALQTDGLLQGLGADEDVTCSASPEPMFFVDLDVEWEKEQLLKG
ncbi:hypothetical protein N324_08177, partial [Chlamydotis macqueenii]